MKTPAIHRIPRRDRRRIPTAATRRPIPGPARRVGTASHREALRRPVAATLATHRIPHAVRHRTIPGTPATTIRAATGIPAHVAARAAPVAPTPPTRAGSTY